MANMLEKLWDDVAGGSTPEKGMKQLRKSNSGKYPDGMAAWTCFVVLKLLVLFTCMLDDEEDSVEIVFWRLI